MHELQPGNHIDSFRIEYQLHESAVSRIYKAWDILNERDVVLKIPLNDIINNPVLLYHHQNEFNIGQRLKHPAVIRYFENICMHQYVVMEFIDGVDLRKKLTKEKILPLESAIPIFSQIAEGVRYLHENNIIHLDIKPENILIQKDNTIKIIDFGLSHDLEKGDLLGTDFQGPKGTPYYIAPEQLKSFRDNKQSDVYSLAILFYEMLTGALPYDKSKSLPKVEERLSKDPTPPSKFNQAIPDQLEDLILSCLNRKPSKRPTSLSSLINIVQRYLPPHTASTVISPPSQWNCHTSHGNIEPNVAHDKRHPESKGKKRRVLGCIADYSNSDAIIDYIRREYSSLDADVTLLHTIEEDNHNEYEQFAKEVEGASIYKKLDWALTRLHHFGFLADMRIRRGNAADQIIHLAGEIEAELIIIGTPRPRSKFSKFFSGSVMEKIVEEEMSNVVVVQHKEEPPPPVLNQLIRLSWKDIRDLETFFQEWWIAEIKSLHTLKNGLMINPKEPIILKECLPSLHHWLEKSRGEVIEEISTLYCDYELRLEQMQNAAAVAEHNQMLEIYRTKAFPALIKIKDELDKIIAGLKTKTLSFTQGLPTG